MRLQAITPKAIAQPSEAAAALTSGAVDSRTMRRGASLMVIFTGVASALNYASNLAFSRALSTTGYGELTALLAFSVVLAVPTGAAQTVIAERVAVHMADGRIDRVRYLVRHALAHVGVIAVLGGAIYIAAIPLVVKAFSLEHWGPAAALAPLIVLAFIQPVALGVLQGLDRFRAFGVMLMCIAVGRIAFGLPWALAGGGAGGALAGQALGMLVVLLTAGWLMRDLLLPRGSGAARSGFKRKPDTRTVSASAAFVCFAVISNLDIVLAKIFMSGHDSGIYAALATIGKVVLFLPAAVAVVMVPNAARAEMSAGESSRVLRVAAMFVGGIAVVAAIPAVLAPHLVIDLMFGSKYSEASQGILPMVIAGGALAMTNLLVVYAVAIRDKRWTLLLVIGVTLQVVGISLFHGSPTQVATVQACVAVVVLALNELWFHSIVFPTKAPARRFVRK